MFLEPSEEKLYSSVSEGKKEFPISGEVRLFVQVDDEDVEIRGGNSSSIIIDYRYKSYATSEKESEKMLEEVFPEMIHEKNMVYVRSVHKSTKVKKRKELSFSSKLRKVLFGNSTVSGSRIQGKYLISLPHHSEVQVQKKNGKTIVSGLIETKLTLRIREGETELSDIRGSVRVEQKKGKITGKKIYGRLRINGQELEITLEDGVGEVNLKSRKGRVLVDSGDGELNVMTINGTIIVGNFNGDKKLSSNTGKIHLINRGAGNSEMETVDGDIHLEKEFIEREVYDLKTKNGNVYCKFSGELNLKIEAEALKTGKILNCDLPIKVTRQVGNFISGKIGKSSAYIAIKSDNGIIYLE